MRTDESLKHSQRCFAIRTFITLAENFRKCGGGAQGGQEFHWGAPPCPPIGTAPGSHKIFLTTSQTVQEDDALPNTHPCSAPQTDSTANIPPRHATAARVVNTN